MLIRVTKPAVVTKRGNVCLLPRQLLHFAFEGAPFKFAWAGIVLDEAICLNRSPSLE